MNQENNEILHITDLLNKLTINDTVYFPFIESVTVSMGGQIYDTYNTYDTYDINQINMWNELTSSIYSNNSI